MIDLAPYRTPLFGDAYRRLLAHAVSDQPTTYAPAEPPAVRERIVRCIWFDQTLATDQLRTDNGLKLRILSPGWWNLEAGPDFRNAAIRIGPGPVLKGDVEVHLRSSLWTTHGHHTDPAYNGVILHASLWNDAPARPTRTAAGATVPNVTLEPYLRTPLTQLLDQVDPAEYPEASDASTGRCHDLLDRGAVTLEWLQEFLDHAGDQRMADKARRLAAREGTDDDQLLYEAIAEALGYKRNKAPALELARRLPLTLLRTQIAQRPDDTPRPIAIEALLFGTAGLLPPLRTDAAYDAAAHDHGQTLKKLWNTLGADLHNSALPRSQWSFDGTRPPNFPTRRVAALAALLATHLDPGPIDAARQAIGHADIPLTPRECTRRRAAILEIFTSLHHPFWDTRTHFAGKPLARPTRLIGTDRAHTIAINAIFPILLYSARRQGDRPLEERLHRLYATYPKLPSTSITRFMAQRLFGRHEKEMKMLRSARRQQGLHQLYTDFCDSDQATCARCPLVRLLEV